MHRTYFAFILAFALLPACAAKLGNSVEVTKSGVTSSSSTSASGANASNVDSRGQDRVKLVTQLQDLAYNGWKTSCMAGQIKTLTIFNGRLRIEKHSYNDKSSCAGAESGFAIRQSYALSSVKKINASTMNFQSEMKQLEFLPVAAQNISDLNSTSGLSYSQSVTGVCGITSWVQSQWQDVTSSVCWNFTSGIDIGDGKISTVVPFVFDGPLSTIIHQVSLRDRNTLYLDGDRYVVDGVQPPTSSPLSPDFR